MREIVPSLWLIDEIGENVHCYLWQWQGGITLLDAGHPTVKLLGRIRSQILATWRGMTLPYTETGVRLMPRNLVPEFEQRMGFLGDELAAAVAELACVQ